MEELRAPVERCCIPLVFVGPRIMGSSDFSFAVGWSLTVNPMTDPYAIYGVTWPPSRYPIHVSIVFPYIRIRHGKMVLTILFFGGRYLRFTMAGPFFG